MGGISPCSSLNWGIRSWQSIPMRNGSTMCFRLSPTHRSATAPMRSFCVRSVSEILIFVTISGSFQNSLETTSLLKELGAKCVVSRAERDVQAKFLLRNGADNVLYPEKQMAKWAAIRYTSDHIFDYIEIDAQHAIFEVEVPETWIGKSVGELDVRRKFGITILGIKRAGKTDVSVTPDTILSDDITILALGEYKALQKCFRI